MSDLHAWPSRDAVDAAFAAFDEHRDFVRDQVHANAGDDNKWIRGLLTAELFKLDMLKEQMLHALLDPVEPTAVRSGFGEDTRGWITGQRPTMRRNRWLR